MGSISRVSSYSVKWISVVIVIGDLFITIAGVVVGFWLRFGSGWFPQEFWHREDSVLRNLLFGEYIKLIGFGWFVLLTSYFRFSVFKYTGINKITANFKLVARWLVSANLLYLVGIIFLKIQPQVSRLFLVFSLLIILTGVLVWREFLFWLIFKHGLIRVRRGRVLFIDWNDRAEKIFRNLGIDTCAPFEIVGVIPGVVGFCNKLPDGVKRIDSDLSCLRLLIEEYKIDTIVVSELAGNSQNILKIVEVCELMMVDLKIIPSFFQVLISGLKVETLCSVPVLGLTDLPLDRLVNRCLKRCVDIVGAVVGMLGSVPLIIIFGIIIYCQSPGPIFYRQVRTGRRGKVFKIIKLRSMRLDAEKAGAQWAKKNDDRRIPIGRFLREWNVDEVPQFWNVFIGEMSLVGPRPERPELISRFQDTIPHYNSRLLSKPGITGWAQVNGLRGDTDLIERVLFDLDYLEKWSLQLDFTIMFRTFIKNQNAY